MANKSSTSLFILAYIFLIINVFIYANDTGKCIIGKDLCTIYRSIFL